MIARPDWLVLGCGHGGEYATVFLVMHLSFASPAPKYPGTGGDCGHTRSLEAVKFPANIRRLPCRAGHIWHRVTDNVHALIPQEKPLWGPSSNSWPKWSPSSNSLVEIPYMFPAGRDVSMHKSPALSQRVPSYCPGTHGPGIQMIGAFNWPWTGHLSSDEEVQRDTDCCQNKIGH